MKTKRGLKSPLEAKIQTTDPIGFFYEQKCPFDENLVYLAQKLSKPLPNVFRDFDLGIPFINLHFVFSTNLGNEPGNSRNDSEES